MINSTYQKERSIMEEGTSMNEDTLDMHKRGQSEFSLENNN